VERATTTSTCFFARNCNQAEARRPGHWEGREERRLAGLEKARTESVQVITQKAREAYADLVPAMLRMKAQGLSLRDIAEKLKRQGTHDQARKAVEPSPGGAGARTAGRVMANFQ
jgi:hypothetical protein